jgi:hypothetical protein
VCELTPIQRKQLAREGELAIGDAARRFVELQQKMMRGQWRRGMEQYPEPRRVMEEVLGKSLTGILSSEQLVRYQGEVAKRDASSKQVALDNLVAKLDADLVLTANQREKISESLSSHWNDFWSQSLQMLQNLEHFFPAIPDELVVPFLTENQKRSWQRIPRNQTVFWGFNFQGVVMEDDPIDDPELMEARREAGRKDARAKGEAGTESKEIMRKAETRKN